MSNLDKLLASMPAVPTDPILPPPAKEYTANNMRRVMPVLPFCIRIDSEFRTRSLPGFVHLMLDIHRAVKYKSFVGEYSMPKHAFAKTSALNFLDDVIKVLITKARKGDAGGVKEAASIYCAALAEKHEKLFPLHGNSDVLHGAILDDLLAGKNAAFPKAEDKARYVKLRYNRRTARRARSARRNRTRRNA